MNTQSSRFIQKKHIATPDTALTIDSPPKNTPLLNEPIPYNLLLDTVFNRGLSAFLREMLPQLNTLSLERSLFAHSLQTPLINALTLAFSRQAYADLEKADRIRAHAAGQFIIRHCAELGDLFTKKPSEPELTEFLEGLLQRHKVTTFSVGDLQRALSAFRTTAQGLEPSLLQFVDASHRHPDVATPDVAAATAIRNDFPANSRYTSNHQYSTREVARSLAELYWVSQTFPGEAQALILETVENFIDRRKTEIDRERGGYSIRSERSASNCREKLQNVVNALRSSTVEDRIFNAVLAEMNHPNTLAAVNKQITDFNKYFDTTEPAVKPFSASMVSRFTHATLGVRDSATEILSRLSRTASSVSAALARVVQRLSFFRR